MDTRHTLIPLGVEAVFLAAAGAMLVPTAACFAPPLTAWLTLAVCEGFDLPTVREVVLVE